MRDILKYTLLPLFLFQACSDEIIKEKFDIDWIYSDEGRMVGASYNSAWINDNTMYLMDMRKPKEERTLLKMNPSLSMKMVPVVDSEKISKSILSAVGRTDTSMYIEWPSSFSSTGNHGIYFFEEDIYMLDVPNESYRRVTNTKSEEKAARFSPDGKKISFVRENFPVKYSIKWSV